MLHIKTDKTILLSIILVLKLCSNAYSFVTNPKLQTKQNLIFLNQINNDNIDTQEPKPLQNSRRTFLTTLTTLSTTTLLPKPSIAETPKILVLGGTGLVGSEICTQLKKKGLPYIATSRDGRDNTLAFDALTSKDIVQDVKMLCEGCTAVISTIGSINTSNDYKVNSSGGYAAIAAKESGIKNFVYISVSPEVRNSIKGLNLLQEYMSGKTFSESTITSNFDSYCIIQPTFIYGGDAFGINPPRVTKSYGGLVENVLSSGLFRALEGVSPGLIGVALKPPVSAERVASAAIAGALGYKSGVLDGYDAINSAASLL